MVERYPSVLLPAVSKPTLPTSTPVFGFLSLATLAGVRKKSKVDFVFFYDFIGNIFWAFDLGFFSFL